MAQFAPAAPTTTRLPSFSFLKKNNRRSDRSSIFFEGVEHFRVFVRVLHAFGRVSDACIRRTRGSVRRWRIFCPNRCSFTHSLIHQVSPPSHPFSAPGRCITRNRIMVALGNSQMPQFCVWIRVSSTRSCENQSFRTVELSKYLIHLYGCTETNYPRV